MTRPKESTWGMFSSIIHHVQQERSIRAIKELNTKLVQEQNENRLLQNQTKSSTYSSSIYTDEDRKKYEKKKRKYEKDLVARELRKLMKHREVFPEYTYFVIKQWIDNDEYPTQTRVLEKERKLLKIDGLDNKKLSAIETIVDHAIPKFQSMQSGIESDINTLNLQIIDLDDKVIDAMYDLSYSLPDNVESKDMRTYFNKEMIKLVSEKRFYNNKRIELAKKYFYGFHPEISFKEQVHILNRMPKYKKIIYLSSIFISLIMVFTFHYLLNIDWQDANGGVGLLISLPLVAYGILDTFDNKEKKRKAIISSFEHPTKRKHYDSNQSKLDKTVKKIANIEILNDRERKIQNFEVKLRSLSSHLSRIRKSLKSKYKSLDELIPLGEVENIILKKGSSQ